MAKKLFYFLLGILHFHPCSPSNSTSHDIINPITLAATHAFLLTNVKLSKHFSIFLLFKTSLKDGVIIYASGSTRKTSRSFDNNLYPIKTTLSQYTAQKKVTNKEDVLLLMLQEGSIVYIRIVNGKILILKSPQNHLSDNAWHR